MKKCLLFFLILFFISCYVEGVVIDKKIEEENIFYVMEEKYGEQLLYTGRGVVPVPVFIGYIYYKIVDNKDFIIILENGKKYYVSEGIYNHVDIGNDIKIEYNDLNFTFTDFNNEKIEISKNEYLNYKEKNDE